MKKFFAALAALFISTAAYAQSAGTVTNHAFAIGKGPNVQGYTSLLCGAGQLAVAQAGADPICRTVSGDWTLNAAGVSTLATVNANVGTFGSAVNCPTFTVNAKGLLTAASQTACTPAVGNISGLGTGAAAALAVNVGTAGSFVVNGGALGTPSSGNGVNLTSLNATNLSSGTVAAARTPFLYFPPQGRLTLQSVTPVMTTTQAAKTTIFYTPYQGNVIPLYDGTNMVPTATAEISVATTDTVKNPAAIGASKVNDWFVWNDVGTMRLSHGPDWTSDTVRSAGTALVMVNGILLNNASITNACAAQRCTYVGTTRSNGSSQLDWIFGASASGGTAGFHGVWNAYNRVMVVSNVIDSGASYTYSSATRRQARASAGNQITFVVGLQEDGLDAVYTDRVDTAAVIAATAAFGVGYDSTSAYNSQQAIVNTVAAAAVSGSPANSSKVFPTIGVHFIAAVEGSDGTNANTFNSNSLATLAFAFKM